jgi:ribose 5-phosphate isomerase B
VWDVFLFCRKMEKIIAIASDHAGFELKQVLHAYLLMEGWYVRDFGVHSAASADYPDVVHPLAAAVNAGDVVYGAAVCGSGQGVCMTANKYPQVRAALVWERSLAALSRQHNNANVICLPARFISEDEAVASLACFLDTAFEGGRHQTRVEKISPKP